MDTRDSYKRTTLRLPQDLYDRIELRAAGKKSLNATILEALEEAFPKPIDPYRALEIISPHLEKMVEDDPKMADLARQLVAELRHQASLLNRKKP